MDTYFYMFEGHKIDFRWTAINLELILFTQTSPSRKIRSNGLIQVQFVVSRSTKVYVAKTIL